MSPSQKHPGAPHLNKANWSCVSVDGARSFVADFSHLPAIAPGNEESSYAIAARNLLHIPNLRYKEMDRAPDGEVFAHNDVRTDDAARRITIMGSDNSRIFKAWTQLHNKDLFKKLRKAEREFRPPQHKNFATWTAQVSPDGIPEITADFSHLDFEKPGGRMDNPRFFKARANMASFGGLRQGGEGNNVVYDQQAWKIKITGARNCKAFLTWIDRGDPDLSRRFTEDGLRATLEPALRSKGKHTKRLADEQSLDLFPDALNPPPQGGARR